jgi:hypothetical protein
MTGFNLVRFIKAIKIGAKETDCETRGHFCDFAKVRGAMNMLHSSLCCFRVKNMKASFRRVQQSAFVSTKWKSRFCNQSEKVTCALATVHDRDYGSFMSHISLPSQEAGVVSNATWPRSIFFLLAVSSPVWFGFFTVQGLHILLRKIQHLI